MKIANTSSGTKSAVDERLAAMKERVKKARRDAYLAAKERMRTDPRTIELKAKVKASRRAANKAAKERRKTDPVQIALKAKRKQGRQEAAKLEKERRKAEASMTKKTERAGKDSRLMAKVMTTGNAATIATVKGSALS